MLIHNICIIGKYISTQFITLQYLIHSTAKMVRVYASTILFYEMDPLEYSIIYLSLNSNYVPYIFIYLYAMI